MWVVCMTTGSAETLSRSHVTHSPTQIADGSFITSLQGKESYEIKKWVKMNVNVEGCSSVKIL